MTNLARATIAKPDFEELHVLDVRPIRSPDGDQGLVVEALEDVERVLEQLLRRALVRDDLPERNLSAKSIPTGGWYQNETCMHTSSVKISRVFTDLYKNSEDFDRFGYSRQSREILIN